MYSKPLFLILCSFLLHIFLPSCHCTKPPPPFYSSLAKCLIMMHILFLNSLVVCAEVKCMCKKKSKTNKQKVTQTQQNIPYGRMRNDNSALLFLEKGFVVLTHFQQGIRFPTMKLRSRVLMSNWRNHRRHALKECTQKEVLI